MCIRDRRGTIYAAYAISQQIGVSPWYWWDDVKPQHQDALYVLPGRHSDGEPVVKYRGFFINDENPDLGTWGPCLLYTSDAADDLTRVDLGGRRIIKKKKHQ